MHDPAVEPDPTPHDLLSQSLFWWQVVTPHVPLVAPEPTPHEALSQSVFLWQAWALVAQAPLQLPLSH